MENDLCGEILFTITNIHNGYYPHQYYIKYDNTEDYQPI